MDGRPCGGAGAAHAGGAGNRAAGEEGADFTGVVRAQDVRATEKDKVRLGECFRPGDIVRASVVSGPSNRLSNPHYTRKGARRCPFTPSSSRCNTTAHPSPFSLRMQISLGDARSYYLSTAHNSLGVLYARSSAARAPMEPISWDTMRCTRTGVTEKRKCAKPEGL